MLDAWFSEGDSPNPYAFGFPDDFSRLVTRVKSDAQEYCAKGQGLRPGAPW